MITKEALLNKYNISERQFASAGMEWEDLCEIFKDFSENKYPKYKAIADEFVNNYLKEMHILNGELREPVKVHSYRFRVKDPEHLIVKIIRKREENYKKYQYITKDNYEKFITDLIGIRCLVLFKADWESFHNYLISKFENNVEFYIKDPIQDFDADDKHAYMAEAPKAHIRNGDNRDIYEKVLPKSNVIDDKVYRSIHYIIKYSGVYLEIQVRTLFEEGWGEVDHAVVYPYYKDDPVLKEYTELLNRLSGLADEMGSFFYRLKELEKEHLSGCLPDAIQSETETEPKKTLANDPDCSEIQNEKISTIKDCVQLVLNG